MDDVIQPAGDPPVERQQGVYSIRVTLYGNGETKEPTLEEMQAIVSQPLAELGWRVGISAERVD